MENHFGFKDFFLMGLIGALIVLVLLAMRQYDRQWQQIQLIKTQNDVLAQDVGRIKRQISDGLTVAPGMAPTTRSSSGETLTAGKNRDGTSDPFYLVAKAKEQPDFSRGDWYIDNFGTKIGKLTPLVSTDIYQTWIEYLVTDRLAYRDPYTLQYVPQLCRGWTERPDGLEMTFQLRDGVTFSDGQPLTAEDVVFTFDWIRNADVNAPRSRSYMTGFEKVEALDSLTVRFSFKEPYWRNLQTIVETSIMPKHFYTQYTPAQFNDSVGLLIGSGPFMLESPTSWTPGSGVTLVRNPRYWGEAPAFDRVVFREIEDEAAGMVLFGNGEIDLLRCTADQYERLRGDQRITQMARGFAYDTPYGGYTYIAWNQKHKEGEKTTPTKFADPRVRRAMTMLINRDRIAAEVYRGHAVTASGPFSPKGQQADPSIAPWPYDPEGALRLLAEVGYADRNGDGVLEDDAGKQFTFKLTYPSGNELVEKLVRFMKDDFARGNIVMNVEPLQWPVLVEKLNQSDFEAVTLGWSAEVETDPYQIFHSSQIADNGDNRSAYVNKELDKVIEEARVTLDVEKRMQLWHRVHQILHEDQPYTFMMNRKALRFANNRIAGIETSNVGLNWEPLNSGFLPWYVVAGQQRYTQ